MTVDEYRAHLFKGTLCLTYSIQDNVFGLRYRSLQYDNTASSLWPCQKHYLKHYIPYAIHFRLSMQSPILKEAG